MALIPADEAVPARLAQLMGADAFIGVSMPLSAAVNVQEASRQAHMAAENARESGESVSFYGTNANRASLFPRSLPESQAIVDRVLGKLLENDRAARSELLRTLEIYLREDRSFVRASKRLG